MRISGEHVVYGSLAVLVGLSILACSSSVEGEEGNIQFRYDTGEFTREDPNFAVGTKIRVRGELLLKQGGPGAGADAGMTDAAAGQKEETSTNLTFTDVTSSDASIIAVREVQGRTFLLESLKAGSATIEVTAEGPNGTVSDRVAFRADEVSGVDLYHDCLHDEAKDETPPAYLSDQSVLVGMSLKNDADQTVVGYGYYPVEASGSVSVDQDTERVGFLKINTGESTGESTLTSTLGDGQTSLKVFEQAAITGMEWYEGDGVDFGVQEGKSFYLHPVFKVDGTEICNGKTEYDISVETEDICEVTSIDGAGEEDLLGSIARPASTIVVEAKKVGTCKFSISLPAADADISRDVEVTVD